MEFKNSNQLMEYWETKVKEFEKNLIVEFPNCQKKRDKNHVLLKQKIFRRKRKYANNLHALFYVEGSYQNSNEVDRKFDREFYPAFYSF